MVYLKAKDILDKVATRIIDDSAETRVRMMSWLNDGMRSILREPREWWFLRGEASIAVVSGAMVLPSDFGEVVAIELGSTILGKNNLLSTKEAFDWEQSGGNVAAGYTLDATNLYLVPAPTNGTAVFTYIKKQTTDLTDVATDTIFPIECAEYLKRFVLTSFYEFDVDDRLPYSRQILEVELRALKAYDNRQKPIPKRNPHGYTRERV